MESNLSSGNRGSKPRSFVVAPEQDWYSLIWRISIKPNSQIQHVSEKKKSTFWSSWIGHNFFNFWSSEKFLVCMSTSSSRSLHFRGLFLHSVTLHRIFIVRKVPRKSGTATGNTLFSKRGSTFTGHLPHHENSV